MSSGEVSWQELLSDPTYVGILVRGIIEADERETRPRFRGQKPRVIQPSEVLNTVAGMVTPIYSQEPFREAIRPLLKPSMRGLAQRAGMSVTLLSLMVKGERALTKENLERIAHAARVNPGYFREYRDMVIADMVNEHLAAKPDVHLRIYHHLSSART